MTHREAVWPRSFEPSIRPHYEAAMDAYARKVQADNVWRTALRLSGTRPEDLPRMLSG